MKTQKLTALLAALILLTAAGAQEAKKEAKKELSNTRIASCLVKVTCDPAALPLSLETIDQLLHSSGVGGKAVREILDIPEFNDEIEELVQFGIEPISGGPSSGEPKAGGTPYGVAPDEEDEEYMRELKVLARKEPALRERLMSLPIPDAPTYSSQQTLFFRLQVSLSKEVKPAAEEFMKALIDNLRKSLDAAWGDYSTKLSRGKGLAHSDVMNAKANLTGVQEKLREILGSYNLERQAILDDMTRLRKEFQTADMEVRTSDAFVKETSKRIPEIEANMNFKIKSDPVLHQLQEIVNIHEERLSKLLKKGEASSSESEISKARENLLRARIELAERREQVSQSAGAELINSLRNQISELTIQQAQALKRMSMLELQLHEAKDLLARADEYERISLELKIAREVLEEALLLHSRLKRKSFLSLLTQPSVFVFGAD